MLMPLTQVYVFPSQSLNNGTLISAMNWSDGHKVSIRFDISTRTDHAVSYKH